MRAAYAESSGLILLSDFEAFGIPILEALACATPVFLSRLDPTQSLFGTYRAAHFCDADDLDATARVIEDALARGPGSISEGAPTAPAAPSSTGTTSRTPSGAPSRPPGTVETAGRGRPDPG